MAAYTSFRSLLAQIDAGVLDDEVPLSSLLQKCLVLGGDAGSKKMRNWARQELNGYHGPMEEVPTYRHVPAALMAVITSQADYNGITRRIPDSAFLSQVRDIIREKVDLEDAILTESIGELEAMASRHTEVHNISPGWGDFIADTLNKFSMAPNSRVADVYWAVPNAAVRGLLIRVRAALADLVAELARLTPQDQQVPPRLASDQAMQFVINGDRATIHYSPQSSVGGGTNVTVGGSAPGTVTVVGAHGSATGGRAVQACRDAVMTARDATTAHAEDPLSKDGWWARLRKWNAVVAVATIVGAIATVVGTVVAVCAWTGWTP
jgi:AbiTii